MFGYRAIPCLARAVTQTRSSCLLKAAHHVPKYHFAQTQLGVQSLINQCAFAPTNLMLANLRELLLKARSESENALDAIESIIGSLNNSTLGTSVIDGRTHGKDAFCSSTLSYYRPPGMRHPNHTSSRTQ